MQERHRCRLRGVAPGLLVAPRTEGGQADGAADQPQDQGLSRVRLHCERGRREEETEDLVEWPLATPEVDEQRSPSEPISSTELISSTWHARMWARAQVRPG
jgi:hypothetical protein